MSTVDSTRRGFLEKAAAAASFSSPGQAAGERPNILYVMTDQQHYGMMSCEGNRWLKTPAMDSIAANGVRFGLAYSSNPVCMPARTSMMTGHYPSRFDMRGNTQANVPSETIANGLGNLFRKAGYRTWFGGKTHWPKPMTPENLGFEYLTADERDDLADVCSARLRNEGAKGDPFLMVASFINPHDICYMAIDAYTKANNLPVMHPKSDIERKRVAEALMIPPGAALPPLPANHGPTKDEPAALGRYGSFRGWARKHWTAEDWRRHRWAYCRLTERVDAEIGRLLGALRESGLERNTVVLFSSDHGDMDSAHGFEHKSLPFDESARVPFIVKWPGHTPKGKIDRKHFVSSCIDLMPTLCDYAGIEPPKGLPGRSVRPIVERGSAPGWREDVAIECTDSRCLRTASYKYSVFEGPGRREMMIDMNKDPGETANLAADPKSAGLLADHRARLRRRVEELGDKWGKSLLEDLPT